MSTVAVSKPDPRPVYLREYQAPDFLIPDVELDFNLDPALTRVTSRLAIQRNPDRPAAARLVLNSQVHEIQSILLDSQPLPSGQWNLADDLLSIELPKQTDHWILEIHNTIQPDQNTALEGLYISGGKFCTQNEAEGFRRITPFLDRPDVMSRYRCRITADPGRFGVLLSNGNRMHAIENPDGTHTVEWVDPFAKPCYLFALVGGNLGLLQDEYTTGSGRNIKLEIYTDPGNEHQAVFAMQSLKRAMRWDEETFGLEYDLDLYMIVAVMDFNMGAMENKGLNVFNARLVLADEKSASDELFESIEAVIAHEYFHNWTGNRITCRDWFQLSLKEGLTVYRDQRFTADMTDAGVKRIKDVQFLRTHQFAEDAGPLSHPVQPDSYIEINNFYTLTVYEKGAELVRMIATLIGEENFARGITEYFKLYDGQAVTIDEFLSAMQRVSGLDVGRFKRWYKQSGTPRLAVTESWDAQTSTVTIRLQQLPASSRKPAATGPVLDGTTDGSHPQPEQQNELYTGALFIPVRLAVFPMDGSDPGEWGAEAIQADWQSETGNSGLLSLQNTEAELKLSCPNAQKAPCISILRNFSAPVVLDWQRDREALLQLFALETDPFSRYEAGRELMLQILLAISAASPIPDATAIQSAYPGLIQAFRSLLRDPGQSDLFKAWALPLPSFYDYAVRLDPLDLNHAWQSWRALQAAIGAALQTEWQTVIERTVQFRQGRTKAAIAGRKLRLLAFSYLAADQKEAAADTLFENFRTAETMTEEMGFLQLLCDLEHPHREAALQAFRTKWAHSDLVLDNWFMAQAASSRSATLADVIQLSQDPAFRLTNPNKVRALYGTLTRNLIVFHQTDGAGYYLIRDQILQLNHSNPQVAAALCRAYSRPLALDPERRNHLRAALAAILAAPALSNDVFEIANAAHQSLLDQAPTESQSTRSRPSN
ncbi:MAG: aminopeptidase N [Leptospiraceae bacterium]|nr:aminopeptidase N [Leptospiraceae bacterium]